MEQEKEIAEMIFWSVLFAIIFLRVVLLKEQNQNKPGLIPYYTLMSAG